MSLKYISLFILLTIFLFCGNSLAQTTTTTSTSLGFQWDSNTEPDLAGYGFYVGDDKSGPFDLTEDNIPKSDSATVNFRINDIIVNINAPIFFVVDAFDTEGHRSGFSNPCEYVHCVPLPEETQIVSCDEGYTGTGIVQKRTSSCTFNSYPVWSQWIEISKDCTALPVCIPGVNTRTLSCGEGYTGLITQTQTISCPSKYSNPVVSEWVETGNTCTALPVCTVPAPETQTLSCGEGYSGNIIKTRTASCPDKYGTPVWSDWVENNTCQELPLCTTGTDSRTLSCPDGQIGNIIETRNSTCPDKYGTPVWSDWSQASNTCVNAPTECSPVTETKKVRCEKWYYKGSTIYVRTKICNSNGTFSWTDWTLQSSTCRSWWGK
jgi:hypothetical protein